MVIRNTLLLNLLFILHSPTSNNTLYLGISHPVAYLELLVVLSSWDDKVRRRKNMCNMERSNMYYLFFEPQHSDKYLCNIKNCWGILWSKVNLHITLRQGYIVIIKTLCFILTLIWSIFQSIYNGIVGLHKTLFTTFLV
jgi:hypothetical protein